MIFQDVRVIVESNVIKKSYFCLCLYTYTVAFQLRQVYMMRFGPHFLFVKLLVLDNWRRCIPIIQCYVVVS